MRTCVPIWAYMGPCGPIWAHMCASSPLPRIPFGRPQCGDVCPYGPTWAHVGPYGHTSPHWGRPNGMRGRGLDAHMCAHMGPHGPM